METIKIGQIVNAVGLKGEVKVYHHSDYKERFEEFDTLYGNGRLYRITSVRYMKEMVILKLEGVEDRTAAEQLKGMDLFISEEDLRELPEDTYYVKDLKGLCAVSDEGIVLGQVCDVVQNSAQDIYVIEREDKSRFMLPAVEQFILNIDMENKTMTVHLIDGILEL